ncbi:DUF4177 domain-containing protein [[Eubacterium] cellulosolvens]
MRQRFEYKFVRLGESVMGVKKQALDEYQPVINDHVKDGWRLVQIFSPFIKMKGYATFIECIFEREL